MKTLTAVLLTVLVAASCGEGIADDRGALPPVPDGPGTWRELPAAPVPDRPFAVSGWSGSEALFWAGSNLRRNFAHTEGAAYDPATDTWRRLPVPGWGHPGLTGAFFDGDLYVAAKGGTSRIDLSDGADHALPQVPGFTPATMVATGKAVWALGPGNFAEGVVRVGIARYVPADDSWVAGPTFAGAPELGDLFRDQLFVDQPVLWTGSEIVVWAQDGYGASFDPEREQWRVLPPLVPPRGTVRDSRVAVVEPGLAVLAAVDGEVPPYGVASWDGEAWAWQDLTVDFADFAAVTVAGAGDWLVVFGPPGLPHTIHLPTGLVVPHEATPFTGVQAPNAVWTETELVVWGGEGREFDTVNRSAGAVWQPPGA